MCIANADSLSVIYRAIFHIKYTATIKGLKSEHLLLVKTKAHLFAMQR